MTIVLLPRSPESMLLSIKAFLDDAERFLGGNFVRNDEGIVAPSRLNLFLERPAWPALRSVMCAAGPLANSRSRNPRLRHYARQQLCWSGQPPYRANYIGEHRYYVLAALYHLMEVGASVREFFAPRRRR